MVLFWKSGDETLSNCTPYLPLRSKTLLLTCTDALSNAIITHHAAIPDGAKRDLAPIVGKYLPVEN